MKSDSENENDFEDAVDTIAELISQQDSKKSNGIESQVPKNELSLDVSSNRHSLTSTPQTSTWSISSSSFAKPEYPISASHRRGRIAQLRSRMQHEFGATGFDDDASQSPSERTSLASWGRNLLMEQTDSPIAVRPTDSLSTRGPAANIPPPVFSNFQKVPYKTEEESENEEILLKSKIEDNLEETLKTSTETHKRSSLDGSSVPSSPPPVHPPPPLPESLIKSRETETNSEPHPGPSLSPPIPPPLPPRKAINGQSPKLPDATPELAQPLKTRTYSTSTSEHRPEIHITSKSPTLIVENTYGRQRGHAKTKSLDRGLSLAKSMKSGPFPPPSNKSNSLNRGCSPSDMLGEVCEEDQRINTAQDVIQQITMSVLLSKDDEEIQQEKKPSKIDQMIEVLFQLCSSESVLIEETVFTVPRHSTAADLVNLASQYFRIRITNVNWNIKKYYRKFNRFISLNGPLDSTIIEDGDTFQAILLSTIKFNAGVSQSEGSRMTSGIYPSLGGTPLAAVGEETSSDISTPIRSPETSLIFPRYENISNLSNQPSSSIEATPDNERKDLNSFVSTGSSRPPPRPEGPRTEFSSYSKSMPGGLLSATERPSPHQYSHLESIDPITRDVERRMSMKNETAYCISDLDESRCDNQLANHSNVSQPKSILRSYGSAASGFFKGAFEKAKSLVISNQNQPKSLEPKQEEDEEVSESDEGTVSVSDHIPPTLPSSVTHPEIICRPKNSKKGPFDFDQLRVVQELDKEHTGAVCSCGKLMATAGADNIVRVWVLKSYLNKFTKLREEYNKKHRGKGRLNDQADNFSSTYHELDAIRSIDDKRSVDNASEGDESGSNSVRKTPDDTPCSSGSVQSPIESDSTTVMDSTPFCIYRGHTAHVLDLSWSPRNYFILSSGMDCTVRLWHLTRSECLCCFQHMDFVTCVAFMPKDDRYFISGSLDGKIRLWHIPEKKVALWNEVEQVKFITAITFVRNGKFVVVGTYNGRCFFYSTDQLKYHTVIDVRSSRGKNAKGHKITSLAVHGDKLLVTSNDSRIRMYDLRDMNLTCKFKGHLMENSHIRASFSPDGKHIISGSEDNYIYLWKNGDMPPSLSVRKDRNGLWERVRAHCTVVTAAVFAPKPSLFLTLLEEQQKHLTSSHAPMNQHPSSNNSNTHNPSLTQAIKRPDTLLNEKVERSLTIGSAHNALSTAHLPLSDKDVQLTSGVYSVTSTIGSVGMANSKDRQIQGDIIVSADLSGCIKIMANPSRIKTGSSHFFPTEL